jgi:deoxyribodipyrimidine photo-lyase
MTPALQERIGCVLGQHYPLPIVEPTAAARQARQRIWAQRQQPGFKELAGAINQKHGSRRSNLAPRTGQRRRRPAAGNAASREGAIQLGLDLDLDLNLD